MAKVALCWELGAGSGHLSILADFVQPLKDQGHDVCLIIQNLQTASKISALQGLDLYQAPSLGKGSNSYNIINYSSMLLACGYDDPKSLSLTIKAWRLLFKAENIDFVIGDHCPTAVLTAKLMNLACAMTGSAFMVPPLVDVMPSFRLWEKVEDSELKRADEILVSRLNTVLSILAKEGLNNKNEDWKTDHQPFNLVKDMFSQAHQWISSFPEADHYGKREQFYFYQQSASLYQDIEPIWPNPDGEKVFIYLNRLSPHIERIFTQLRSSPYSVLAIVPGFSDELIGKFATKNLKIQRELVDTRKVAEQCRLVVSHAGYSTTMDFLLKGVPSLLIPLQVEATMLSIRLGVQKLGFASNPSNPKIDVLSMLETVKKVQPIWDTAAAFAEKYRDGDNMKALPDVMREHIK